MSKERVFKSEQERISWEGFLNNLKKYGMSKRQYKRKVGLAKRYGPKVWEW